MKVTAILPEKLIDEVRKLSKGKNITDSLQIALNEWINQKHIVRLNKRIFSKPLQFSSGFSTSKTREINRRS